jgi:hypothetical protein
MPDRCPVPQRLVKTRRLFSTSRRRQVTSYDGRAPAGVHPGHGHQIEAECGLRPGNQNVVPM